MVAAAAGGDDGTASVVASVAGVGVGGTSRGASSSCGSGDGNTNNKNASSDYVGALDPSAEHD